MTDPSPRVQLRTWIRAQITGEVEVQLPDLTARAVEHFSDQRAFIKAFLAVTLPEMVYEQARTVLRDTREWGTIIQLGDTLVSQTRLEQRARVLQSRWSGWMERVGDRHINLLAMTRDNLLAAAEHRRTQASTELAYADLWETLAEELDDWETVGQRFTPEDLEALRAGLVARTNDIASDTSIPERQVA